MNINEIANLSGVSKATVSRVLNNSGYVSQKTRDKVEAVIRRHAYTPSVESKNHKKKTNTIGVIIPEISNSFFGEIMEGISSQARKLGYSVIFCNTDNNMHLEEEAIYMMRNQEVSALIITPATGFLNTGIEQQLHSMYENVQIPIIVLDKEFENTKWDGVYFENYQSTYLATSTLLQLGHKEIGIISGEMNLKIARQRVEGYESALKDTFGELCSTHVFEAKFHIEDSYQVALKALKQHPEITAFVTSNNLIGLGFIKACRELDLEIGVDVSLIGIDAIPTLEEIGFPYSCVSRNAKQMGEIAANKAIEKIKLNSDTRSNTMIACELHLRGSQLHKSIQRGIK